jgi:hypothetical protein
MIFAHCFQLRHNKVFGFELFCPFGVNCTLELNHLLLRQLPSAMPFGKLATGKRTFAEAPGIAYVVSGIDPLPGLDRDRGLGDVSRWRPQHDASHVDHRQKMRHSQNFFTFNGKISCLSIHRQKSICAIGGTSTIAIVDLILMKSLTFLNNLIYYLIFVFLFQGDCTGFEEWNKTVKVVVPPWQDLESPSSDHKIDHKIAI